jgi:hypothetical protein
MESSRWYLLPQYEFASVVLNDLAGWLGVEICVLAGMVFVHRTGYGFGGVGVFDTGSVAEPSCG